ncbi:MAG: FKBP-type peptidyl-prolyl cis-trans isomerase [Verrucomicrobia bacterium]|nr:MAG: FKBP-type peptidyl-prolyl cis-trans isomerase [Verrucomicrobiota bacterium]
MAAVLAATAEDTNSWDAKQKASYAIGQNMGAGLAGNITRQEAELDNALLSRGFTDGLAGKGQFTEAQIREVLTAFQQDLQAKQQEKRKLAGEKNKADGEKFLAENKTKPGVVALENGLQYKVVTEGKGETPKPDDMVDVNYRGTLIDGTEFDSSAKTGRPATFRVGGVIKGWQEALTRMKAGSKWQLFIPADLAYGEFGSGPKIGPNSVLIFDVELLAVKSPPPPAPAPAPLTSDIIKVPSAEEMKKGAKIETIKAEDVEKLQKQAQEDEKKKAKK